MITRLEQECEFMSMSIWCNVNLWVWRYNIMGMCIANPFYGNVDLHDPMWIVSCYWMEGNYKSIEWSIWWKTSRTEPKKNSIDFDLEKVGSLQPAPKHPFLFKRDINVREEEEVTFPLPQNRPQQAVTDLSLFQLNKSSYMSPSLNVWVKWELDS
jgi:hypothetical protein